MYIENGVFVLKNRTGKHRYHLSNNILTPTRQLFIMMRFLDTT
ncbi:MAG: hypothetical protein ACI90V_009151 [Bacillariaceae sp.]|jgi:hypothetical protein